ncbi:phosphoglycolate phosphatase-like HAD superfamily hydrolase [Roseimicrobium gellanilyticum]|uniref:phosphoglycolate phosphatase n=1 Tax=Roseimicrobium gellanilyticum TaxID=748857 RepID=A0A366HT26_9BACT|nr:HAD family hydrolase [Roseimicrobium gellanilyticum]RBP46409.1 phosphoglycolate phosphatase-like HAD superfamily hydrolase [Roseimicrobium gellanilyticum]
MNLIMFDIDGTLTASDVMDGECFVQAVRDVFGFEDVSSDWSLYRHCSDSGVLDELFHTRVGRAPQPDEVAEVQAHFVKLMEASIAAQPLKAIPGAKELLEVLLTESRVAISLASGAWECSARLKLRSAGLDFPHIPGAFADDAHAREDFMQASLQRVAQKHGREEFDSRVYIGDGVWDVRASRNLGFGFIGIASEQSRIQRLRDEGASVIFPDFTQRDAFRAALETARGQSRM